MERVQTIKQLNILALNADDEFQFALRCYYLLQQFGLEQNSFFVSIKKVRQILKFNNTRERATTFLKGKYKYVFFNQYEKHEILVNPLYDTYKNLYENNILPKSHLKISTVPIEAIKTKTSFRQYCYLTCLPFGPKGNITREQLQKLTGYKPSQQRRIEKKHGVKTEERYRQLENGDVWHMPNIYYPICIGRTSNSDIDNHNKQFPLTNDTNDFLTFAGKSFTNIKDRLYQEINTQETQ